MIASCGFNLEKNLAMGRELMTLPAWNKLKAVKQKRVWAADANSYFSRPAPRVVEGAELLARILSGGTPDPRQALRL